MQTTVGIVGLGNAGSAMATALSGKMPLVGFDANPERQHAVAHLALEWVSSLDVHFISSSPVDHGTDDTV
jgi:3-hydroxyisobutyrate dehydrogenase-like beta-hydroxyacid dehydrogenase